MRDLFLPAAAIAFVAQVVVLYAVMTGRAPASAPGRSARWAEVAWVLVPTIVLIAILFFTWNRLGPAIVVSPAAGVPA
jgi:hypothetical protein